MIEGDKIGGKFEVGGVIYIFDTRVFCEEGNVCFVVWLCVFDNFV